MGCANAHCIHRNMDEMDTEEQTPSIEHESLLKLFPSEIIQIVRSQNSPHFLDTLASKALNPTLTSNLFAIYEPLFADSCARWVSASRQIQNLEVIAAIAQILPLAPYLSIYLDTHLSNSSPLQPRGTTATRQIQVLSVHTTKGIPDYSLPQLQSILLATLRLLNFDKHRYAQTISSLRIQTLLQHEDRCVRYLAVRIFCQLCSASDYKLAAMIHEHVGIEQAVSGSYDGVVVDYGFLSLYEEKRLEDAHNTRAYVRDNSLIALTQLDLDELSPLVKQYGNTLLPRLNGIPQQPSRLIATTTTLKNVEGVAKALLSTSPILLHGLPGSGKTALVNDLAVELGVDSNMVTLHLNEQTDAKMLIGLYATGSKPGSFTWRPGVLTTAVREGRWVFIEDLDRAPNEVISVILPLIERGELHISSRGETIKAAPGFRLLATVQTSVNTTGKENPPPLHMLGSRLWKNTHVEMPSLNEFGHIIVSKFKNLCKLLPGIMQLYESVYQLTHRHSFTSRSRISLGRSISPRDLLKWCRRLSSILDAAGMVTGEEPLAPETTEKIFMGAVDCFAGHIQSEESRKLMIACLGENMNINPQMVEQLIASVPRYEEGEAVVTLGRTRLEKKRAGRGLKTLKTPRPFANTNHAKKLLEQVGVAVEKAEPVLLVGETGIGKTTVIQRLADSLNHKLVAVNLSRQSEVSDLLGGFKPISVRSLAIPLKEEFDDLFENTGISATKNQRYLEQLGRAIAKGQWSKASKLWHEAPKMFEKILGELTLRDSIKSESLSEQPSKRRKTESRLQKLLQLQPRWDKFSQDLKLFDIQLSSGSQGFAFQFIEGNIVKAVRNGDWVLLDEINLASPDTLECIADLVQDRAEGIPSILLSETGEIERIRAHPNFRIFGAMNPATDVGKRDLPMSLRSRFTEIYVDSPDRSLDDLLGVIGVYLKKSSSTDERAASDVARLYLNTKRLATEKRLVDGANQVPHFSLRTLTRVLSYATEITPMYGLRRALYEGFSMGFLTLLDRESERLLMPLINHHLLDSQGNPQALLAQTPRNPDDGREYVKFTNKAKDRQYWMLKGTEPPHEQPHYIITPFVEHNMLNLVRATSTRRFPVLIQGPTSSGKTSMVEYLAKFSGNKFVRINNHEHTDLQEYLGTYVSGSDGQLYFQEGLLVQALRQGHWIVLDELNLAPTDVLEALNRLLDDNRELLIPETQEIVRPHENFMLFATQNPPGLYGGRKTLSRAFRNRFLELHFDDIPEDELDFILEKRSQNVAPSDCRRIVAVYKELSRLRQSNRLFEQKDSFATLRDLFRWALRSADNREQLAENGYMLLAERVRNADERIAVKEVIERVMKVKIDPHALYNASTSLETNLYNQTPNYQGVVWTGAMRRLYILAAHAIRHNEPILLVGETGCGKTTVCQMLAEAFGKELHIVNAHQNTEAGDLIGAQRPVRGRAYILEQLRNELVNALNNLGHTISDVQTTDDLIILYRSLPEVSSLTGELQTRIEMLHTKSTALFEWSDGSLVQAMKTAQPFLLDEISLADDSVLERLNSVLEPQRTILLAEKGIEDSLIRAADGFQFFATMNPGGDYGKRELSPALRNRFTEIWVPSLSDREDVLQIVDSKLEMKHRHFANAMVSFTEWFGSIYRSSSSTSISVRDILAWIKFVNGFNSSDPCVGIIHGASMVYIDTLGANPAALLAIKPENIEQERIRCLKQLSDLLNCDAITIYSEPINFLNKESQIVIGHFSIAKQGGSNDDLGFAFEATTTKMNAMRILRALQVQKPILLEGSPGVGKTTLVAALAHACNRPLTRINLSEQTDLMDLFGSDVPVEGAQAGYFTWRDAPFLQAMQKGEWVLLDEMNLASQPVLEGLNACLDHRGEVYISELDKTFKRHPNFSVFAAQNPHHQGGGRKGLPSSFVNRFTVVYADVFRDDDLKLICKHNFPGVDDNLVNAMIEFVSQLENEILQKRRFGSQGGPWEFNLRDILRWLKLLTSSSPLLCGRNPADFISLIFRQRFRTAGDRQEVDRIFTNVFQSAPPSRHFFHNVSSTTYQVGLAYLSRDENTRHLEFPTTEPIDHLAEIESVMICIQQNIPCILAGPSGSGKSTILQHIAASSGVSLVVFPLNADIDAMDLVGGFEQADPHRVASAFLEQLRELLTQRIATSLPREVPGEAIQAMELLRNGDYTSSSYFSELGRILRILATDMGLLDFANLATTCEEFSSISLAPETAKFEWVDGVLIKALKEGSWLVLDNANLCSASVLDRLNSLLEPNGSLIINEHCGADGEPSLIIPHPDFRIFLTMDPRFGELSRAMRNRAVEIYVSPVVTNPPEVVSGIVNFPRPEADLERYRGLVKAIKPISEDQGQAELQAAIGLDNLAWSDFSLLPRFTEAVKNKGFRPPIPEEGIFALFQAYLHIYQSDENSRYRLAVSALLDTVVEKNSLSSAFRDAQTVHSLQNSPLVPLIVHSSNSIQVYWLAAWLEFKITLSKATRALEYQESAAATLKPSEMNRLQRSLIRHRFPGAATDSTVQLSKFLGKVLNALLTYLSNTAGGIEEYNLERQRHTVLLLIRYWWETYNLSIKSNFEEATFQAHLAIGSTLISKLDSPFPKDERASFDGSLLSEFKSSLEQDFVAGFKLKTGLSMEALWRQFRPITVSNIQLMETIQHIEELSVRFDALRWSTSISIDEIGSIMTSLVKAYHLILTTDVDGTSLVQVLSLELDKLSSNISAESTKVKPFMTEEFGTLRQYRILETLKSDSPVDELNDVSLSILANQPTLLEMRLSGSQNASRSLQAIDYLFSHTRKLQPAVANFSVALIGRLNKIKGVDMKSLKLLESELPAMGQKVSLLSKELCQDQNESLGHLLRTLLTHVLNAHDNPDLLSKEIHSIADSDRKDEVQIENLNAGKRMLSTSFPPHFQEVFWKHFAPAMKISSDDGVALASTQNMAMAWVHLAIGLIKLYVPDKVYDPDRRQRLERDQHENARSSLLDKLKAVRLFEASFTNQSSNLRCEILEKDLLELGEPLEATETIFRPESSELHQLQGEFNNILKLSLRTDLSQMLLKYFDSGLEENLQEIKLLQRNIDQIIQRLSERYRVYNDLTNPVINFLHCLQIGLFLASSTSTSGMAQATNGFLVSLSNMTPFLGGRPETPYEDMDENKPLDYIHILRPILAIEGVRQIKPHVRQALLKCFQACYDQWTQKLESDRSNEEAKVGLYRFRGSFEDEDEDNQEEFNKLFPSYEDRDSGPEPTDATHVLITARDFTLDLAKAHANIFSSIQAPQSSIFETIRSITNQINDPENELTFTKSNRPTKSLLPGALLLLSDQMKALTSSSEVPESYNFYTGANLNETRKLVSLIHQIQRRFSELQKVDEISHMQPLEDVLISCRELLEFCHTEPLAKIITKVEKIHGFMHEWQFGGWASKANSALALYDAITSTIVSWRRLELSTWAKLFDMECKQCDDDARSWWFIAYQVVIAAPLQLSESLDELKAYSQRLLQDLQVYFSTSVLGQFLQRLKLLRQLQAHLEVIVIDIPSMSTIHAALNNFITLYSGFETTIKDTIKKGRLPLEKAMRDILLLASWKDTNIIALRDSAKRSHHKLFKVVRKFRALLGQPIDVVIKHGLPDLVIPEAQVSSVPEIKQAASDIERALAQRAAFNPKLGEKSKRLINVSHTMEIMTATSRIPQSAVNGSDYLESFLANVTSSTKELQDATPSVLTEENKVTIKHLKTRKRKLYAEILKDLRQMGVKYNLGGNALIKQSSLALVLAASKPLSQGANINVPGLIYYFNKAIDVIPRARESSRQPSEDLSGAEVSRSLGFLEGLLQIVLVQRDVLASSSKNLELLGCALRSSKELWAPHDHHIIRSDILYDRERTLQWLPNILNVASHLLKIHAEFSKIESDDIQKLISSAADTFSEQLKIIQAIPSLPYGLNSTEYFKLYERIDTDIQDLRTDLKMAGQKRPDLAFIFDQILPWTTITKFAPLDFPQKYNVTKLDEKVSSICDSVLVAIEKQKKHISDVPTDVNEAGWFAQNDTCLVGSIKSLHCEDIAGQLSEAFEIFQGLDLNDSNISRTAGAIFAIAIPILQQYYLILQRNILNYGRLHRTTCKTLYVLANSFIQISSNGFCTPAESSQAQDGKTEKLEGGTGLGDGEGAEDISKDIKADEDLDELAQEPNKDEKGEIEDEKDAVDMADGDMEGEMGEGDEENEDDQVSGDEKGSDEDIDEEAGDVDDLDPTAVDEKMWDGDGDDAEKEQEGDDSNGKVKKDEQVAAEENKDSNADKGDDGEEGEEEDAEGIEQSEEVTQDDIETHDPHAQEGEALDLPEDMQLDGSEGEEESVSGSEADMDDLSDIDKDENENNIEEDHQNGKDDGEAEEADGQEDQDMSSDMDVIDLDEEQENEANETEEVGEKAAEDDEQPQEDKDGLLQDKSENDADDIDNAAQSDVQGLGQDQDENNIDDKAESSNKAKRNEGGDGGDASEANQAAAEDGQTSRQGKAETAQDTSEETQDGDASQPFKKLGDALESWHREQAKNKESSEAKEEAPNQNQNIEHEGTEFQHLQDEDAQADTQALGTATDDQAHALDESMAIDTESKEMPLEFPPEEAEQDLVSPDDVMNTEEDAPAEAEKQSNGYEGFSGAIFKQENERDMDIENAHGQESRNLEDEVDELDNQLDTTHLNLDPSTSLRAEKASELWTYFEASTRDLSLSLTEQLRLILAPTLATKMRGDFRTGKRLNIKRIIPYIASQYKRDKIWMRRSVPSKRSYQIMLAVDDSKSMSESGSGALALETLVMVSKSLSMLEVGEICVVCFGEIVKVAHDFDTPFSSDAGSKIFQEFSFNQSRTNVKTLVSHSIELFRTARAKAGNSPTELWQLQLIISDGVCDSSEHDSIRRLLRTAIEERIMMVFVIVDDLKNKKKGESVMELKEAKFVKNDLTGASTVKIERYLDTFPFPYYLIVSDVRELPGVLATLLRQWFSEVVDSSS